MYDYDDDNDECQYGILDESYTQIENELDLSKIYIKVKDWLVWEERVVFCYILLGDTLEDISEKLVIPYDNIVDIKQNLLKKLQYGVTILNNTNDTIETMH